VFAWKVRRYVTTVDQIIFITWQTQFHKRLCAVLRFNKVHLRLYDLLANDNIEISETGCYLACRLNRELCAVAFKLIYEIKY
jgi:hypothetical protein